MSKDTAQFLQFVAAILGLGLIGGLIVKEPWIRGYEVPFGIVWIVCFLLAIGFIANGVNGAKTLVSYTFLMWAAAIVCAAFIAWMAIAGAGHSL